MPKARDCSAGIRTALAPRVHTQTFGRCEIDLSRRPLFIEYALAIELAGEQAVSRRAFIDKSPANLGVIISRREIRACP